MKSKSNAIAAELKRIASVNGGVLEPALVVKAARPLASPLHSRFEWDNSKAADAHRLWQARQLITMIVEIIPNQERETQVYVSLKSDRKEGGYRAMIEVMSDSQMRAQLLAQALDEMDYFEKKYHQLKELEAVFTAARRVLRGVRA